MPRVVLPHAEPTGQPGDGVAKSCLTPVRIKTAAILCPFSFGFILDAVMTQCLWLVRSRKNDIQTIGALELHPDHKSPLQGNQAAQRQASLQDDARPWWYTQLTSPSCMPSYTQAGDDAKPKTQ